MNPQLDINLNNRTLIYTTVYRHRQPNWDAHSTKSCGCLYWKLDRILCLNIVLKVPCIIDNLVIIWEFLPKINFHRNFWKLTQLTSGARHNKKRPQLISRLAWAVNIKVIYLESYSWYGYTFFTRLYMSHIPCLVRPKLISLTWVTNLFLEVVVLCDLVFPSFEFFVVSIAAMQIFGQSR